jgi:monoamine oxidase
VSDRLEADVCVVGAGFAGLTAAWRLRQAGLGVVVLEARSRVGGRVWTQPLSDGTPVDRGGAWFAPQHTAALALAREFDVGTYKTWVRGAHLLVGGGKTRKYTGLIPKISPLAVATIGLAQWRLDRLARRVPVEAPWEAKDAAALDARSVKQYLARAGVRTAVGRDLYEMAVRGLFASDLADVSLLDLLFLVHAHGSINTLFSIEGGSQENLIDGGAGTIAARIASALGDAVHLGAPVRSISQSTDRVEVTTDHVTVHAHHAVVTIPPVLALDIAFEPALSPDRRALYQRAVAGSETKSLLVYDTPFWREQGFSGQTAEPGSPAEVTIDASPAVGSPGVLAVFSFGRVAEQLGRLSAPDRRDAVVRAVAARLGPRANAPVEWLETSWWDEEWSRGCSVAHFAPGVLTHYGPLLRAPFGLVHFAGTETATVSHGAIDGAVRSGERVAAEILSGAGLS